MQGRGLHKQETCAARCIRCSAWLGEFVRNGSEESMELCGVELVIGADTAAKVETKGSNCYDGLGNIAGVKAACEKYWNGNGVTNASADSPIMAATGPAELLNWQT